MTCAVKNLENATDDNMCFEMFVDDDDTTTTTPKKCRREVKTKEKTQRLSSS